LRVPERIEFKLLILCHKCTRGTAPVYLQDLLQVQQTSRSLRSSDGLLLVQPIPRGRLVTYGDGAFCIAPRLWNKLPLDLRQVMSTSVFVTHLKTYLCSLWHVILLLLNDKVFVFYLLWVLGLRFLPPSENLK
jgi:hypothetical protein